MTGRIKLLSTEGASGYIKTENGQTVYFDSRAVLAYDSTGLAVGQLVTFDLQGSHHPKAVNICVQKQLPVPAAEEKRPETSRVRYVGFAQNGSIREYRFEQVTPGEETRVLRVLGDLALFARHRVGIQDGPSLCLRLLVAELNRTALPQRAPAQRSLTDLDLASYVASRPAPGPKHRPRRFPRAAATA